MLRLPRGLAPTLLLTMALPAQDAGRLQFRGDGASGSNLDILISGAGSRANVALVLSPEVGETRLGSFESDCFAPATGIVIVPMPVNTSGAGRLTFGLPTDPQAVGVYLVAEGIELVSDLPRTNCASFIVVAPPTRPAVLETFDDVGGSSLRLGAADGWADELVGALQSTSLGGSGALGVFDHTQGTLVDGVYVFSTDRQVFPGSATLSGRAETVTDGRFEFLELVIPAGVQVRFEGSHAAHLLVAGRVEIAGTLDVSGRDVAQPDGAAGIGEGQEGGGGGPGAGAGGRGGDLPSLIGGSVDGAPGDDMRVPGGSGLGQLAVGTGGRGSLAHPAFADPLSVNYAFLGLFSNQISGAGGGGGYRSSGAPGGEPVTRLPGGWTGVPGAGGVRFDQPLAVGSARLFRAHGGAGGGGAGTHAYDSVLGRPVSWVRGSAGAGGGGVLVLASARDVVVAPTGSISAIGGSAASRDHTNGLLMAPGGGGSGGTLVIQSIDGLVNDGVLDVSGGLGGTTADLRQTIGTTVIGGAGAPGSIRIEGSVAGGGSFVPPLVPSDAGELSDEDGSSVHVSTWRRVPAGGDPALIDYEVYAVVDGLGVIYSDRIGFGSGPTLPGLSPVVLYTRFATLDARGEPTSVGAWSAGSATAPAGADGVQFAVRFDRALARTAHVDAVRLSF